MTDSRHVSGNSDAAVQRSMVRSGNGGSAGMAIWSARRGYERKGRTSAESTARSGEDRHRFRASGINTIEASGLWPVRTRFTHRHDWLPLAACQSPDHSPHGTAPHGNARTPGKLHGNKLHCAFVFRVVPFASLCFRAQRSLVAWQSPDHRPPTGTAPHGNSLTPWKPHGNKTRARLSPRLPSLPLHGSFSTRSPPLTQASTPSCAYFCSPSR